MNIEQAIEILSDTAYRGMTTLDRDFKDAVALSIEALKRMREAREYSRNLSTQALPGEE